MCVGGRRCRKGPAVLVLPRVSPFAPSLGRAHLALGEPHGPSIMPFQLCIQASPALTHLLAGVVGSRMGGEGSQGREAEIHPEPSLPCTPEGWLWDLEVLPPEHLPFSFVCLR